MLIGIDFFLRKRSVFGTLIELLFIAKVGLPIRLVVDQRTHASVHGKKNLQADVWITSSRVDFGEVLEPEKLTHLGQTYVDELEFFLF